jgi:tetratricopeptide (TPR) repeat protein
LPIVQPANSQDCHEEPTIGEVLLQLGILYWRRGDFDRAEQLLTKARDVSKGEKNIRLLAQCFIGLALVKTSLEKSDDAIASYEQAISLVPEDFHLWNNLGNLYIKHNKYEQAIEAFIEALNITPDNIVSWNGLASSYYQNGSIEEAINAYKHVVDLIPNAESDTPNIDLKTPEANKYFVLPWLHLAELYTKKCQYQKAIDAYLKVLAIDGDEVKVWNEVGALYIKMEAYQKAHDTLSKALEMDPCFGPVHLNLAIVLTKLGQHQDGISHYVESIGLLKSREEKELALDLMEQSIRATQKRGSLKNNKSKTPNINKSVQEKSTWFYSKYNKEITSVNLTYFDDNLENFKKRTGEREMSNFFPMPSEGLNQDKLKNLPVHPDNLDVEITDPYTWIEKGNIHFSDGAYESAMSAYNRAIEINPTFGQPYHNLALICFMQGNYNKAILLFQKSITLLAADKEKAVAWNGLGNVYRCIKDYERARVAYQNASEPEAKNGGVNESAYL